MSNIADLNLHLPVQLFEDALGLEQGTFKKAIVPEDPESLSSMRTLHYLPSDGTKKDYWRNGPHADLSLLTLLFQREGEAGLEICPGREALTGMYHESSRLA